LQPYLKSNPSRNRWTGEDGDDSMKLLKAEVHNENRSEKFAE
jgi:hypothetical protein